MSMKVSHGLATSVWGKEGCYPMGHQCRGRGKGEGDVCESIPWLTLFGVVGRGIC